MVIYHNILGALLSNWESVLRTTTTLLETLPSDILLTSVNLSGNRNIQVKIIILIEKLKVKIEHIKLGISTVLYVPMNSFKYWSLEESYLIVKLNRLLYAPRKFIPYSEIKCSIRDQNYQNFSALLLYCILLSKFMS